VDPAKEYASPYVYVGNQPSGYIDPNGKFTVSINSSTGNIEANRFSQLTSYMTRIGGFSGYGTVTNIVFNKFANDPSLGTIQTDLANLAFELVGRGVTDVIKTSVNPARIQEVMAAQRAEEIMDNVGTAISGMLMNREMARELFLDEATFIFASALRINGEDLVKYSIAGGRKLILNERLLATLFGTTDKETLRLQGENILSTIKDMANTFYGRNTIKSDHNSFFHSMKYKGENLEIMNEAFYRLIESSGR
jgi:hypothetical protein